MAPTPAQPAFRPDPERLKRTARLLRPLQIYHRYEVTGLEHVPREGGCLLVCHHSAATYDGFLLGLILWEKTGRLGRGLGDDRIFQTPGLSDFARQIGLVPASPTAGQELLAQGELVGVAPGGMWEALRPREQRYQVRWEQRRGFCRLALRAQVPMLLAACPRADDLYEIYGNPITDALYQRLHLPLPLMKGLGPTLLPRPEKLVHHLAPLIHPPPHDPDAEEAQVDALHAQATAVMQGLLARR